MTGAASLVLFALALLCGALWIRQRGARLSAPRVGIVSRTVEHLDKPPTS